MVTSTATEATIYGPRRETLNVMYDRVLLPTDGTTGAERAIEHAIDAAQRYDAELHVLYVVDEGVYGAYPGDEYVHESEGAEQGLEDQGEKAVQEIAERAQTEGVEAVTAIQYGTPHEEILRYIDEEDIDIAILGSKDRSGEYRRLIGSVAERVARMSKAPVTVVKTPVE